MFITLVLNYLLLLSFIRTTIELCYAHYLQQRHRRLLIAWTYITIYTILSVYVNTIWIINYINPSIFTYKINSATN